jgi:hypothetical protein
MDFVISFPSTTFVDIADALHFADKYSCFDKQGIPWFENNNSTFLDYVDEDTITKLKSRPKQIFSLVEQFSDSGNYGKQITYRKEKDKALDIFFFDFENLNVDIKLNELLIEAVKRKFSFAYLGDSLKSHWQNQIMISNYQVLNKPYKHLPQKWDRQLSPIVGPIIDISVNPGHQRETYQMRLMAAPEMWFGPSAWQYFDKNAVMSFPHALDIEEVFPDVVNVKLFDPATPDYETSEILSLQKEFRDWVKMDEIEKNLDEKLDEILSRDPQTGAYTKVDIRNPESPETSTGKWYIPKKRDKK